VSPRVQSYIVSLLDYVIKTVSLYVYIYTYMQIYMYIYVYMYICINTYTHTRIHTCKYIYISIYTYKFTYTYQGIRIYGGHSTDGQSLCRHTACGGRCVIMCPSVLLSCWTNNNVFKCLRAKKAARPSSAMIKSEYSLFLLTRGTTSTTYNAAIARTHFFFVVMSSHS